MKKQLSPVKNINNTRCSIDEMDTFLDQIADFKKLMSTPHKASDPAFLQEYRLFKQHVEWVSEDLVANSYICEAKSSRLL